VVRVEFEHANQDTSTQNTKQKTKEEPFTGHWVGLQLDHLTAPVGVFYFRTLSSLLYSTRQLLAYCRLQISQMVPKIAIALLIFLANGANSFLTSTTTGKTLSSFAHRLHATESESKQQTISNSNPASISIENYTHKEWKLTYLYKKAAPGHEHEKPIILIHPIGVGISSWFWTKLMTAYGDHDNDNPAIYAPDLIGCGLEHGADAWIPEEKGLFFPLSWVEGVETLMETVVIPRYTQQSQLQFQLQSHPKAGTSFQNGEGGNIDCTVVVQGGLVRITICFS